MNFTIDNTVLENYPSLYIGLVVVKNADNTGNDPAIRTMINTAAENVKAKFADLVVSEHPHINPWREAYRKFGAKPSKFRCSSWALVKAVLKGRIPRHINTLVDLYNYVSLKYVLTLGGEDLDTMEGDLVLDYATGNENFIPLGETDNDPPTKGEVVYKDDLGVVCRRWNWREGDRTKSTAQTKNAVLVCEGLGTIGPTTIETATNELAELVRKHCNAETKVYFLSKKLPHVSLN